MPRELLKSCVRKLFHAVGMEVRRVSRGMSGVHQRESMLQVLEQARSVGFVPQTVIDVGAAFGSFTRQCQTVFPDSEYLLIEPLEEYRSLLDTLQREIPSARYFIAAASARTGELEINVHPDLVGSSLYREVEKGTDVNGVPRLVRTVTIDQVVEETKVRGPFLLKLDVQGAEIDALQGAESTLERCQFVVLEVSFFKFFQDGPECSDIVAFMKARGFVPYDIIGLQYRPLDRALSQADIAFVREDGLFRRHHFYAMPEQREAQNRQMQQQLAELFQRGHHA